MDKKEIIEKKNGTIYGMAGDLKDLLRLQNVHIHKIDALKFLIGELQEKLVQEEKALLKISTATLKMVNEFDDLESLRNDMTGKKDG